MERGEGDGSEDIGQWRCVCSNRKLGIKVFIPKVGFYRLVADTFDCPPCALVREFGSFKREKYLEFRKDLTQVWAGTFRPEYICSQFYKGERGLPSRPGSGVWVCSALSRKTSHPGLTKRAPKRGSSSLCALTCVLKRGRHSCLSGVDVSAVTVLLSPQRNWSGEHCPAQVPAVPSCSWPLLCSCSQPVSAQFSGLGAIFYAPLGDLGLEASGQLPPPPSRPPPTADTLAPLFSLSPPLPGQM